jgi:hypothetical protein
LFDDLVFFTDRKEALPSIDIDDLTTNKSSVNNQPSTETFDDHTKNPPPSISLLDEDADSMTEEMDD